MLQRFFAGIRAHYGITVFFLYLGAFAIAFVGTFTLLLIAIGMVLFSIFLLVPAVLVAGEGLPLPPTAAGTQVAKRVVSNTAARSVGTVPTSSAVM